MAENKMGVKPVAPLLMEISFPMMVSMLVQALYNIVDSIFVSRVSENALSAVSLAFPIQTLMIALGTGTGVGINALLSKQLGEKKPEEASKTAMNGVFLAICSYIVFVFVGLLGVKPFYASQIKDADPEIMELGIQYLTIVCFCSFGVYAQMVFEKLLQATGKTVYSMICQITGAVINVIMDPILIFGLVGMPKLGVRGAALATIFGQIVSACLGIYFNLTKNKELTFKVKGFRPNLNTIGRIYSVGLPSIIMQAIGSVMTYGMNRILIGFTSTATAVFGVYYKLQSFFFMPVFGLNNGMVPIIAYNYGAGKRERVTKTIKWSLLFAFLILLVGFGIFELFPTMLLGIFDASDEMVAMGVTALRIIGIHYLIAWYCIIIGSVFQALGNGIYSLVVSVARQLVVLLPAAYILSKIGGLNAVWWAFPIAELMSAGVTTVFLILINKKVISKIPNRVYTNEI